MSNVGLPQSYVPYGAAATSGLPQSYIPSVSAQTQYQTQTQYQNQAQSYVPIQAQAQTQTQTQTQTQQTTYATQATLPQSYIPQQAVASNNQVNYGSYAGSGLSTSSGVSYIGQPQTSGAITTSIPITLSLTTVGSNVATATNNVNNVAYSQQVQPSVSYTQQAVSQQQVQPVSYVQQGAVQPNVVYSQP